MRYATRGTHVYQYVVNVFFKEVKTNCGILRINTAPYCSDHHFIILFTTKLSCINENSNINSIVIIIILDPSGLTRAE